MFLPTSNPSPRRTQVLRRGGFTLIELVLVMTLLLIVAAMSAPALSHFFRGRTLDAEARRFVALARYAQNRAVSEGMPMLLWIDANQKAYGVQMEGVQQNQDPKFAYCELGADLTVQVVASATGASVPQNNSTVGNRPSIRFTPDGLLADTNPQNIVFTQRQEDTVYIGLNRTGLNYEIQTNNAGVLR